MKSLKRLLQALILAAVALTASSAQADTIEITSGSIQYFRIGSGTFSLMGSGLASNGSTPILNPSISLLANGPIAPGSVASTGGSLDSQDGEFNIAAPITVGGVSHAPGSSLLQLGFDSFFFNAPVGASGFVVTAPFALTLGFIEGYPGPIGQDSPLFSTMLTGHGTTILTFLLTPGGQYQLHSQTFIFGQTAPRVTVQPVPEPATALLFLSGVVALGGYFRKKTQANHPSS